MTRAARGSGTIEWHRDRWRIRLRLPDGKRRSYCCELGQTREEAEVFRAALLEELAGTTDDPRIGTSTLGAWAITWLDEREATHRDASGDRQRWGTYLAGTELSRMRLDAIGAKDVRAWGKALVRRSSRRGGHLDRQTARNAWTTLRGLLRDAGEAERMDPARVAELLTIALPKGPASTGVEMDERISFTTETEHERVLDLDLDLDQRSALTVGRFSGMRAGELHGLDWERVLWTDGAILVARSRATSTKAGLVARVPLLAPARDALRERWEDAKKPSRGLVWPAPGGGCHPRGFDWGWGNASNGHGAILGLRWHAGIRRGVTFQDATRHSAGVHLLRGTWAPEIIPRAYRLEEVSRFLRHSSLAVTERYYASLALDCLPTIAHRDPSPQNKPPALVPEAPRGGIGVLAAIHSEPVSEGDSGSRPRELNSGPTVYEDVGESSASVWLDAVVGLRAAARNTLHAVIGQDPRVAALATDLAGRVLDATAGLELQVGSGERCSA